MTLANQPDAAADLRATKLSIEALSLRHAEAVAAYAETGEDRFERRAWLLAMSLADLRGTLERNQRAVERERNGK